MESTMNVSNVWGVSLLMADICEVITFLREDPHYTPEDAAKSLEQIIERHLEHQLQAALNEKGGRE
jgi:hypothetical protein